MTIISNLSNITLAGIYLKEQSPNPTVVNKPTGIIGIVGQTNFGPVGTAVDVSSLQDFIRKFGTFNANRDGLMAVLNSMSQGANQIKFVRVTDGNEAKASAALESAASGACVTFEMSEPGTLGNTATVVVSTGTVSDKVSLKFQFNGLTREFPNVDMDSTSADYLVDRVNDANIFVTATRTASTNNTQLPATGTTTFSGGSDGTDVGSNLSDSAYVGTVSGNSKTGIKVFEQTSAGVNFIVSARSTATINTELINNATTITNPPRIAVISSTENATVSDMQTTMESINSDFVVMAYPWLQVYNTYTKQKEYFPAAPFLAGKLATMDVQESVVFQPLNTVIATKVDLTDAEVVTLQNYRVCAITLVPGLGFVPRNSYTTSSDGAKQQIHRRRILNYQLDKWNSSARVFVGKAHTQKLRQQAIRFFESDLARDARDGRISLAGGGKPYRVVCDDTNNPTEVVQANQLRIDIIESLPASADFVIISIDASQENVNVTAR